VFRWHPANFGKEQKSERKPAGFGGRRPGAPDPEAGALGPKRGIEGKMPAAIPFNNGSVCRSNGTSLR
jgi:hypothetical protein